jgi:CRISPR-associated protein Cmr4
MSTSQKSFATYTFCGMALDPIHVGTGGSRLGRVDNTIMRDPVTRVPKIPGSSLAGVTRAYSAMAEGKYPQCAGLGQPERDGTGGHCGDAACSVCTVFGFATGKDHGGGFAGLAAFSDMHLLLFPTASQLGPQWITCPTALRQLCGDQGEDIDDFSDENAIYRRQKAAALNLGWLLLPVKTDLKLDEKTKELNRFKIPKYIKDRLGVVSDKLFTHIVNNNLEVRTSVAVDPATGAAEEGALFTYEALPRSTLLVWETTCRNPKHFKINTEKIRLKSPEDVKNVTVSAHGYMEHLGIGGMGSRGMGRLRVLKKYMSEKGGSQ